MRDIAFFSKLLALKKPWRVERVSFDTHEHQIGYKGLNRGELTAVPINGGD